MNSTTPDISIIVPILNEAGEMPQLAASLEAQRGVTLELLLCDGGSSDGSSEIASHLADHCGFPVRLIRSERGRGRQMNAGAAEATSGLLLFLHADSRFEDSAALLKAVEYYRNEQADSRRFFAARFGLHFRRSQPARPSLAYFFYESKARLARRECIRGDQGLLLDRDAFTMAGGFDQSLPFLEDLRLVAAATPQLQWRLLPAAVSTSARRFEQEGLLERQVLNAIIVNNALAGWNAFFESLPGLYREQCHTDGGRLLLHPLLEGIAGLLESAPAEWRRAFWQATGRHVASNAWQIFFWLDVRRAFRAGNTPAEVRQRWLELYRKRLERFFQSGPAAFTAQLAVRLWLRWMLFRGTRQTG